MSRRVLVIGFGCAGAAAAITAHDAGASVTVLEKTTSGNCRYSGGFLFDVSGPDALRYLEALCYGRTDRAVLAAYAAGLHELDGWLARLGGEVAPFSLPPEIFPAVFPSWPNFPGADGARYSQFVATGERRPGQALWELLERAVADRGIDVHYASAAKELRIIDGRIGGADDLRSDAVILACGGFEGSDALKEAYLPLAPIFPVGHLANTGDGLLMAQRAGAGLWHMPAFFGWLAFRSLEHPAAFPIDFHGRSHLIVDGDGRRFSDETGWEAHDRVRALTVYLPRNHNHPHLPLYGICDAATLQAGPLNGIVGTPNDYRWSADNSAEVESRWIKRADSVAELATLLGLDSKTLANTLADFNQAAASGHDLQFNRSPDTLAALASPLYAIELWPGVATTVGGPRRNARAEVLDTNGVPIKGLYAAGGTGSVWGHLTQHGGGLTDALVFGQIAGRHAAGADR
jgi:succinate dehydrogenase/fumarate reductase flavoprotein subunit